MHVGNLFGKWYIFISCDKLTFNLFWCTVRIKVDIEKLPTKFHIVKAMVFMVVMYRYESWAIKNADHQRIDAFELWCWRRFLRVPWTVRRSNQSIIRKSTLNIYWGDWCWSWSFGHLIPRADSLKRLWCWERLKPGGGDDRGWERWMASLTQWTWIWANSRRWWKIGKPVMLQSMGSQRVGHDCVTEQQQ